MLPNKYAFKFLDASSLAGKLQSLKSVWRLTGPGDAGNAADYREQLFSWVTCQNTHTHAAMTQALCTMDSASEHPIDTHLR